jgi:Spo0E like sporulation regulatory protein.
MLNTNLETIQILEQKIAAGRQKLQALYDARGCTDPVVLAYSIKLDKLLNEYQRLTSNIVPASKVRVPE